MRITLLSVASIILLGQGIVRGQCPSLFNLINWNSRQGWPNGGPPPTGATCQGTLAGGQWLSDAQAATKVQATAADPNAAENAAGDGYSYTHAHTADYLARVAAFHAAWAHTSMGTVMSRVDGDCSALGPNPTTAEILQWTSYKWGISPLVAYGEATNDSGWNQMGVGDFGCSVGIAQVANCSNAERPNHAIRGLNTGDPAHDLPRESTCFNVDVWAAMIAGNYAGARGACGQGNITIDIASWLSGPNTCNPNHYSDHVCVSIAEQSWNRGFGSPLPF